MRGFLTRPYVPPMGKSQMDTGFQATAGAFLPIRYTLGTSNYSLALIIFRARSTKNGFYKSIRCGAATHKFSKLIRYEAANKNLNELYELYSE
jgi:hypothetical protein